MYHMIDQAKKPSRRIKQATPSENDPKKAILALLRLHPAVAWAERFNTGATVVDIPGQKRRFIKYAFVGCSDILGQMKDGRFIAVEVKRPGVNAEKKATDEQKAFIKKVRQNNGIGIISGSVEEVNLIINGHCLSSN